MHSIRNVLSQVYKNYDKKRFDNRSKVVVVNRAEFNATSAVTEETPAASEMTEGSSAPATATAAPLPHEPSSESTVEMNAATTLARLTIEILFETLQDYLKYKSIDLLLAFDLDPDRLRYLEVDRNLVHRYLYTYNKVRYLRIDAPSTLPYMTTAIFDAYTFFHKLQPYIRHITSLKLDSMLVVYNLDFFALFPSLVSFDGVICLGAYSPIPPKTFVCDKLKNLKIDRISHYNRDFFRYMKNLETLRINEVDSRFKYVIVNLRHLNRLSHLDLNFNSRATVGTSGEELIPHHIDYGIQNYLNPYTMKVLRLCRLPMKTFKSFSTLVNLEELYLHECGLQSINGIEKLVRLKVLCITGHRIHDFAPLKHVRLTLRDLTIKGNYYEMIDLYPIVSCERIRKLQLECNQTTTYLLFELFGPVLCRDLYVSGEIICYVVNRRNGHTKIVFLENNVEEVHPILVYDKICYILSSTNFSIDKLIINVNLLVERY